MRLVYSAKSLCPALMMFTELSEHTKATFVPLGLNLSWVNGFLKGKGNFTFPPIESKLLGNLVLPNGTKYYLSSIEGVDFSTTLFFEYLRAVGALE